MTLTERIVDPNTGGMKEQKDVQLSMLPVAFLEDLGRVYAMGALKYDRDNWRKGYRWSLSYDALLRHLLATMRGEWFDSESGLPHLVHVAWHCATLHTFYREGLGTDDRTLPVRRDDAGEADATPGPAFGSGPGGPSAVGRSYGFPEYVHDALVADENLAMRRYEHGIAHND